MSVNTLRNLNQLHTMAVNAQTRGFHNKRLIRSYVDGRGTQIDGHGNSENQSGQDLALMVS
jgi:hypothetical protein